MNEAMVELRRLGLIAQSVHGSLRSMYDAVVTVLGDILSSCEEEQNEMFPRCKSRIGLEELCLEWPSVKRLSRGLKNNTERFLNMHPDRYPAIERITFLGRQQ